MTSPPQALTDALADALADHPRRIIACSGGVDSLLLADLAHQAAPDTTVIAHSVTPAVPRAATERVRRTAHALGWQLRLVESAELSDDRYLANPVDRCFFCKTNLYDELERIAAHLAGANDGWTLMSGANVDDLGEYRPGLLALRAGPVLAAAVLALDDAPDVLIADATGRDHPRRAGLAVHLGAILGIPTIGVTHRTLEAEGEWPEAERGAHAPLVLDGEVVGAWLRIQPQARPIAVHAGWRTDPETATALVMSVASRVRTPEPLRQARRQARLARARAICGPAAGAGAPTAP